MLRTDPAHPARKIRFTARRRPRPPFARLAARLLPALLVGLVIAAGFAWPARAQSPDGFPQRLPGHTLEALQRATKLTPSTPRGQAAAATPAVSQPLTLTVVLNRTDEQGFQRYLAGVQAGHGSYLNQQDLTTRFGPSQQAYDAVLAWLRSQGFSLSEGSANRLTITVTGTRAQAEQAFAVTIDDYQLGDRRFYANDTDPLVPGRIAADIRAVAGLSDLARPVHAPSCSGAGQGAICPNGPISEYAGQLMVAVGILGLLAGIIAVIQKSIQDAKCSVAWNTYKGQKEDYNWRHANDPSLTKPQAPKDCGNAPAGVPADPTVGLLEFDGFQTSDVANWLNFSGLPAAQLSQLSVKSVRGGVSAPGAGEPEVLLDIDTVMTLAANPSVNYAVYEESIAGSAAVSFISQFTAMTNDKVDVISNSWTACEDEMPIADAQAIDNAIAQAAAAGITVINSAGDNAGACSDGSPNTIAVPAESPNATAVGATTESAGPGFTYNGETLWGGSSFGQSKFFATPAYQQGITPKPSSRSVPDMVLPADPNEGMLLCEADNGGCPNGVLYGGTSLAAPEFAAIAVLLQQAVGHSLGNLNPVLYGAANTAFHSPSSMGTDFLHAGLGSPIPDRLLLALNQQTAGPVDATVS